MKEKWYQNMKNISTRWSSHKSRDIRTFSYCLQNMRKYFHNLLDIIYFFILLEKYPQNSLDISRSPPGRDLCWAPVFWLGMSLSQSHSMSGSGRPILGQLRVRAWPLLSHLMVESINVLLMSINFIILLLLYDFSSSKARQKTNY